MSKQCISVFPDNGAGISIHGWPIERQFSRSQSVPAMAVDTRFEREIYGRDQAGRIDTVCVGRSQLYRSEIGQHTNALSVVECKKK